MGVVGVLVVPRVVVLVGRATRLIPHVPGDPKVYDATIRFGAETDTEDLHGTVVREAPLPTLAEIERAIPRFVGEIEQVPPAYSAKRIDGRRAYELARAGLELEMRPVVIRVDGWNVLRHAPDDHAVETCDVRITCGGGTYVRSLARDLAAQKANAAAKG